MNWTPEENLELLSFVDENDLQTSFEMFATEKNRNPHTVSRHYYWLKEKQTSNMSETENKGVQNAKQWSEDDKRRLVRMVTNGYTYEQIGEHFYRTPDACKQKYLGILRDKKKEQEKIAAETKTTRIPIQEWQEKQEAAKKAMVLDVEVKEPISTPIEGRNVVGLLIGTEIRIPVTMRIDFETKELVFTCV